MYLPRRNWHTGKKENVLFNNALNTFYLRLYDIVYIKNLFMPFQGLLFQISSNGYFISITPNTG